MTKPANGLVILYNYLWAREYDRREESGRKAHLACVQIIIARRTSGTVVALFPITSQPPDANRTALEIPEIDARRIGLTIPSWVIVDEWNLDDLAKSPHIADIRPIGSLSSAFMKRVRSAAAIASALVAIVRFRAGDQLLPRNVTRLRQQSC
jgi:hypothetical protein